uniref:Uncharacterized protein n=1 Tax=Tetradesmus obliquus TaxID=3088 RepID=A0A383V8T0_TETOB|eukprot:jgi/Sobl393_1/6470/SZX61360.1
MSSPLAAAAAEQQKAFDAEPTLSLEQLKQLLTDRYDSASAVATAMYAFIAWSKACGSNDVAVLLRNFDALLQRLSGSTAAYASRTAQQHLRCVARALELLPELQELAGGEQQLQQLLVQVKAAVVE